MDFTDETIPMPRIGDQAPVFDAVTTQGKIHFPLDFNGKWIILFSHPSDMYLRIRYFRSYDGRIQSAELSTDRTFCRRFIQSYCLVADHPGKDRVQRKEKC